MSDDRDLITYVIFGGKRIEVEFRISEFTSRAKEIISEGKNEDFAELAMKLADCFVLGVIRERERAQGLREHLQ